MGQTSSARVSNNWAQFAKYILYAYNIPGGKIKK